MQNLVGKQFGKLAVVAFIGRDSRRHANWMCRCDCGKTTNVKGYNLKSGGTRSCGCTAVHGGRNTISYNSWVSMKKRCYDERHHSWHNYGGRGVGVCERWLRGDGTITGFECFLADMGKRPDKTYSIDRIDTDGDYTPTNCKWSTAKQQARNMRKNHKIIYKGEEMTVSEAASRFSDLSPSAISGRISRGWPIEQAVDTPRMR